MNKIPVGVSQCLMGDPVRFDGSHKRDRFLTDILSEYVEFRPQCPEVAIGLGIPRTPIRLVTTDGSTRVLGVRDITLDVTEPLIEQADLVARSQTDICGYIFMQNSPSCGVFGVKRYGPTGNPIDAKGRGAYAQRLTELMPLLPVEEAGRLNDPGLRDNFITRIYALYDWKKLVTTGLSPKTLIEFYSRYKYQVMAHHVASYAAIGKLLADLSENQFEAKCAEFARLFMGALTFQANRAGNTNAMMHLRGYLKHNLDGTDKQELSQLIASYSQGLVPLVVPLTLLKHHLLKLDSPYLKSQTFWSPHPENLGLRNHIVEP